MFPRSFQCIGLLIILACTSVFAQRRGGSVTVQTSEVRIRIVLENDAPLRNLQLQVRLVNADGVPVGDSYTDPDGQVTFKGIAPGGYSIRVTGDELSQSTTQTFNIGRMESTHSEYVHVKLKSSPASSSNPDNPTISAQAMNVPDKARKEFEKGNEALDSKDFEAARRHYRKASEIYPQYGAAENNLATVCQRMGDFVCAREALDRAIQADPRSGNALLNMGRLKLMEKNLPEAESMFVRALGVDPSNPEMLILMAKTELELRKIPEAVRYAQKVHTVPHEKFAVAHLIAARGLELENKLREAATEYEFFLKEAPGNPEAPRVREALARLNAEAKPVAPQP